MKRLIRRLRAIYSPWVPCILAAVLFVDLMTIPNDSMTESKVRNAILDRDQRRGTGPHPIGHGLIDVVPIDGSFAWRFTFESTSRFHTLDGDVLEMDPPDAVGAHFGIWPRSSIGFWHITTHRYRPPVSFYEEYSPRQQASIIQAYLVACRQPAMDSFLYDRDLYDREWVVRSLEAGNVAIEEDVFVGRVRDLVGFSLLGMLILTLPSIPLTLCRAWRSDDAAIDDSTAK